MFGPSPAVDHKQTIEMQAAVEQLAESLSRDSPKRL
jgi:hypothetical protein